MNRKLIAVTLAVALVGIVPAAVADEPLPPEAPLLHPELARGDLVFGPSTTAKRKAKTVDGNLSDWTGTASGYGGTTVRSRGELIYTDHLFDAYGADDGGDADRLAQLAPLTDASPSTYRLDALYKEDPGGQFTDTDGTPIHGEEQYGDLEHVDAADLREVRLASDGSSLFVLARTTTMRAGAEPTLLVQIDGVAHYISPGTAGAAFNADGYTNAIEARIPLGTTKPGRSARNARRARTVAPVRVVVAAGTGTGDGFVPANVAFRTEPVRIWWDEHQALALHDHTYAPFEITVDVVSPTRGTRGRATSTASSSRPLRTSPPRAARTASGSTTASTSPRATTAPPRCP
jgi:hypothetical protein